MNDIGRPPFSAYREGICMKLQFYQAMAEETYPNQLCDSTSLPGKQEGVIRDSQPVELHVSSNDDQDEISPNKITGALVTPRLSRAEIVRQDAKKLRTATLSRMGKMFKQRSRTPIGSEDPENLDSDAADGGKSTENSNNDSAKKEKSNSLGRMLKLVDSDGAPKKLFHPRAGSLSRLLRGRQNNNENNDEKKTTEDSAPGIFSRMLNQLRGRPQSGNASLEPNIKAGNKASSLPPKAPLNSRVPNLSSSPSASSPQKQLAKLPPKLSTFEYSI